jgi:hypothetical protein
MAKKEDEEKGLHSQWIERALHQQIGELTQEQYLSDIYSFTKKRAFDNSSRLNREYGPSMLKLFYPDFNQPFNKAVKAK